MTGWTTWINTCTLIEYVNGTSSIKTLVWVVNASSNDIMVFFKMIWLNFNSKFNIYWITVPYDQPWKNYLPIGQNEIFIIYGHCKEEPQTLHDLDFIFFFH